MSVLKSLQQQVSDQLLADPSFATVPVLTENIGDLQSEITKALGPFPAQGKGRGGLLVVVTTPTANANWPEVAAPFFDHVKVVVSILENVKVNRNPDNSGTGIPAPDCAENVCYILHQFQPGAANGPLTVETPTISIVPDVDFLRYDCKFRCAAGIRTIQPTLLAPTVGYSGGVITISQSQPGAATFYTLDGTNPSPRGSTASLYTAPFTPGTGLTLSCRSWLAGYCASPIAIQPT